MKTSARLTKTLVPVASGLVALAAWPAFPAEGETPAAPGEPEVVVVTAERVRDRGVRKERLAAHVTVYTGEDIRNSGALTLAEFFTFLPELTVFDEVGNGVQSTVDIRGFNSEGGTPGMSVYVDGVRFNEPRLGAMNWELLDPAFIERVEIIRGPASGLYGSGALGGAVFILTRAGAPGEKRGSVEFSQGAFDTDLYRAHSSWGGERWFANASASRSLSDGWRQNSGHRATRALARAGYRRGGHTLTLGHRRGDGHYRQPGALLQSEWDADPTQCPFNRLDFAERREHRTDFTHRWEGAKHSWLSILSWRRLDSDSLTTGRSPCRFRPVETADLVSLVSQATFSKKFRRARVAWIAGADAASDRFKDTAFSNFGGFCADDALALDSESRTTQETLGFFAEQVITWRDAWTLRSGLRGDYVGFDFRRDEVSEGAPRSFSNRKNFDRLSPHLGVRWHPKPRRSLFVNYSKAFRVPSVQQMFAFPTFGSNEDLAPARSRGMEAGWSERWGTHVETSLGLFSVVVQDEIFFVVTDPAMFKGQNENAARTRRRGVEAGVHGTWKRVRARLAYAFVDAEFDSAFQTSFGGGGVEPGKRLPQIPEHKILSALDVAVSEHWSLHARNVYVSGQFATSDYQNAGPKLSSYNLLSAGLRFVRGPWSVFADVHNALDRTYATRGITAGGQAFFTPALPRRVLLGVRAEWDKKDAL
jgi:outer membrane receptor protein involved in Fe transport